DARGRGRRVHPAEEARMTVSHRVGEDFFASEFQRRLERLAPLRQPDVEERAALLRRHRAVYRAAGHALHDVRREIGRAMREGAEAFEVEHERAAGLRLLGGPTPPYRARHQPWSR